MRDEREGFVRLTDACQASGWLSAFTVANFAGQGGSPNHLNLITLHSAKGCEFDVVVIMGLEQGRIPKVGSRIGEDEKREQRRLFYVELTRAKHEVHLTYSGWYSYYGRPRVLGPSEFLLDLEEKLLAGDG